MKPEYFGFCYECEEYCIGIKESEHSGYCCRECKLPFDDALELHFQAIIDFAHELTAAKVLEDL